MKITLPLSVITLLILSFLITFFLFQSNKDKLLPIPFETIIIDNEDDNNHIKKQKWIEEMHRSAPEDNWRYIDQLFRVNNQPENRGNKDLPIYGKWHELGSNNQAGRTVYTYFDKIADEMYVAADGGQIWIGNIGVENWYSINDHFKIPAIRFIKKFYEPNYTRLLVHSAAWNTVGMMFSDDEGQNWTLSTGLESIVSWGFVKRTVIQNSADKAIYCISSEWDYDAWHAISCIYKSMDLGETFYKIHTFDHAIEFLDIWTSQTNESPVYVLAENEFYYLDDFGNLISIATLPNQENGNTLLTGFDTGSGLYFYTMVRFNNQSHFYASGINGQDWQEKGSNSQGPFMVNSFVASPEQKDLLYFGGLEAFSSINAGLSWIKVNNWGEYYNSPEDKLHADIPSFNSFLDDQENEFLFINTDGGTYISYDQMENVDNLSLNNLRISQYYSSYTCRFDPSNTHSGSQDQGYQRSKEGMNENVINYDQLISGDYGNLVSGDGGASIWMVYPGFAMYGPDINNNNSLILENFVGSNYQWMPKLMEDPDNPENVYLAGGYITSGAHLMLLERNGYDISYTELTYDFSNGTDANISAMAYSKINTEHRYVLTSEKDFFYSTDAGNSWIQTAGFSGPGSHYFYGASIAPSNNTLGLLYIGGSGYSNPGVYRSTDNGQTFSAFAEGLPSTMIYQIAISHDDSLLFAATEVGAFVCKTWEEQWYALSDSVVPDQSFWAVDFIDTLKLARFSTYGRGIWDFKLDPDVVADFVADKININTNETIDFTDLSSYKPISWNWYFEGGIPETSNEQNPTEILYQDIGTYDVKLIVTNDHSADTITKFDYIMVGLVSVVDILEENYVTIYPNPASSVVNIKSDYQIQSIVLLDYTGKKILEAQVTDNLYVMNTSQLDSGVYLFRIITEKGIEVKQIIIN